MPGPTDHTQTETTPLVASKLEQQQVEIKTEAKQNAVNSCDDENCPISLTPMILPLKTTDEHTYEAINIVKWFAEKPSRTVKSPLGGTQIAKTLSFDLDRYNKILPKQAYSQSAIENLKAFALAHNIIITGLDKIPTDRSLPIIPMEELPNLPTIADLPRPQQIEEKREGWSNRANYCFGASIFNALATGILVSSVDTESLTSPTAAAGFFALLATIAATVTTTGCCLPPCLGASPITAFDYAPPMLSGMTTTALALEGGVNLTEMSIPNAFRISTAIVSGLELLAWSAPTLARKFSECCQSRFFNRAQPAAVIDQQPLLDAVRVEGANNDLAPPAADNNPPRPS